MSLKRWLLWFTILFICNAAALTFAAPEATATTNQPAEVPAANTQQSYTLQQINGAAGILLRGASSAKVIYLPTKQQWTLQGISLHLLISHAAIAKGGIALTLYGNDTPIGSLNVDGIASVDKPWDITIPSFLLKNKIINLKVTTNVEDYGYNCYNLSNPIYWVFISGDSTVNYQYTMQNYTPDLTTFPYPFVNDPSLEKDTVIIVLADEPNLNDLSAAFYVANALNARATWRGINLIAIPLSKLTETQKATNNLIFIGEASEFDFTQLQTTWPLTTNASKQFVNKDNKPIGASTGIIMLATSTWNPHRAMMAITSNDDIALVKAALMLRDPNFVNAVTFNEYALVNFVPPRRLQHEEWKETTLASLGYKDQVIYGNGENALSYRIELPMTKTTTSLKINLNYSASPFLSTTQASFLTIKLNDIPVVGTALKPSNESQRTQFTIDGNNLRPGSNDLTFSFNLKLKNRDCTPEDGALAWASIFANTELAAEFDAKRPFLTLSTFSASAKDVVMSVSSQKDLTQYNLAQQILAIGNRFASINSFAMILSDSLRKETDADKDIIYVGNPVDNAQLNALKGDLPFYFENNKLVIDKKLLPYIAISDETPVGLVEVIPSPFNPNKLMLLISGVHPAGYDLAFQLLTDQKKFALVNGNVVLVYANGTFTSLQSQKLMQTAENKQRIENIGHLTYTVAAIVGGVLIIALMLFWIYRRMKPYYSKDVDHDDKDQK